MIPLDAHLQIVLPADTAGAWEPQSPLGNQELCKNQLPTQITKINSPKS